MLKKTGLVLLVMLVLLLILPALIVKSCGGRILPDVKVDPITISVWNHKTEELITMPLGEYLGGVVAAEMPAQFHIEALKAQAIVARTYTIAKLRASGGGGCNRHPEADICTDHTHCQAWTSKEAAAANWPFFRQRTYWRKIVRAVTETQNLVITFEGKLIDAVYHSTCGGSTENSEDVWSNKVAYLRAVQCDYCRFSPRYTETVRLTAAEVADKLGVPLAELKINVLERSSTGRIINVNTGKEIIRGLEFRGRLGLRSSKVSWLQEEEEYSFTTVGYGHAVGMCQYGADGMARQGYTALDIIGTYYTGVQVVSVQTGE
ncbi:MAG: stage II sporulation protein D [Bacillota bacterium]|jgi:stage II sporulation protein D|nr:stage II sporulation protein D [Bacillota bacterium]HOC06478.1 stage II sporulation protein D [Bacillota bacterium]HPZ22684.1 stage II sporulation protein D [Bacillota bacterium]HQD20141.1 stage II sporulation protein D [Bacillota bacterium]